MNLCYSAECTGARIQPTEGTNRPASRVSADSKAGGTPRPWQRTKCLSKRLGCYWVNSMLWAA